MSSSAAQVRRRRRRPFHADGLRQLLGSPTTSQSTALKVWLSGAPSASKSPGGGEIQMWATCQSLKALGLQAQILSSGADLHGADVLHLFGSLPQHSILIKAARQLSIP